MATYKATDGCGNVFFLTVNDGKVPAKNSRNVPKCLSSFTSEGNGVSGRCKVVKAAALNGIAALNARTYYIWTEVK